MSPETLDFEEPSAALLQLSSGTTGHRKGVAFDYGAVVRHVADYNRVLGLQPSDCLERASLWSFAFRVAR